MLARLRSRLTYANIVATLALFLAVGGGTTAVALQGRNTVDSGDIINQQVRSADLQDEGVASRDIQNFTVTGDDVSPNDTLNGAHLNESSLATVPSATNAQNIADGSVTARKLGIVAHRQNSVVVPGGTAHNGAYHTKAVTADCQSNEVAVGGRATWLDNADDLELFLSAAGLSGSSPPSAWPSSYTARGGNDSGVDRTLLVIVHCLQP